MKRNLLLTLIIAMSLPMLGNPIDENTAKQLAQNFWKENNIMGVKGDKVFKKKMGEARFVNIAPQCGYSEFYIFNNEGGKGFVIIAADDCVTPILGYSYDNNFAAENLPPNLKGWLDGYAEQIRIAVDMRATVSDEIRADWECLRQGRNLPIKSETAVDHLLSTTWGQGDYYNLLCPEDNSSQYGGHALTGCAATAMAQILKFWEYPNDAHSVGWHEYEHPVYGTLGAYYGYDGGSYYWNFMPNQLNFSTPLNQKQAVASLMYHCGVSVEMNYGPNESSAYTTAAEIAFRAFFDYNNATLVMKSSYDTDMQWINLLKNELDNGRPIFYAGSGTGGHAFVCEGYNNSNYFYFNWGWSGQANGHFPVSSLTPLTTDGYQYYQHDYSYNQQAIIGIEPGGTNNYHLLGMNDDIKLNGYYGNMYCFDTQIQEITTEVYNWGNTAFNGSLCAVVFDGEGLYITESESINNCQIPSMQSSGQLSFTFSESLNILSCKAYVGIYSIENNQYSLVSTYGMHQNPSEFYNYYTFSEDVVELYLYSNIEYSPSPIAQNSAISVTANIINDDPNSSFNGYFAAALYDLDGELKQILATLYEENGLQPGYYYTNTLNFSCPSVTVPAGTYYLTIIQQPEGSDNWYPLLNWEDCVNPEFVNPIRVEVFSPTTYTITATANPSNGGTITGQGDYFESETCTLTATANSGYTFVNWTENGTQVSTNPYYTFTVTGNRSMVANFQAQQQQHTINVSANPTNGGSVSIAGEVSYGFENGFEGWTSIDADGDGFNWMLGSVLMTGYIINAHNGEDMVCSQSYDIDEGALTPDNYLVSPLIELGGSITFWACAQDPEYAAEHFGVAVSTTNNTNASAFTTISEWTISAKNTGNGLGNCKTRSLNGRETTWIPYTVDLSAYNGQGYVAIRHFGCNDQFYLNVDDVTIHTIGGNTYYQGQTCTVHATANNGYTFVNWTENGTQVSTNANYTFTVTGNRNLVAHFQQQQQQYTISVSANPSNGGSVSGGGTFNQGASCTVHATANSGYTFVNWTENGTQVSTNANYAFTVTGNRNLIAHFQQQQQQYTISVSANPSNGGSVSGGGTFNQGTSCTVHATANSGYTFVNWTENGTQVSTNANYSFTVTGNRNLVANFAQSEHTIQATAGANGIITPSGTVTVTHGANQSFAMIPDAGYEIQDVYIDGNSVGALTSYTFTNVTANHYIHVTFVHVDSVDDNNILSAVVYPNPTSGEVTIECERLSHVRIVNTFGQTVYNADHEGNQAVIDLSQMAKGIYMMHIEAVGGQMVRKIVVE